MFILPHKYLKIFRYIKQFVKYFNLVIIRLTRRICQNPNRAWGWQSPLRPMPSPRRLIRSSSSTRSRSFWAGGGRHEVSVNCETPGRPWNRSPGKQSGCLYLAVAGLMQLVDKFILVLAGGRLRGLLRPTGSEPPHQGCLPGQHVVKSRNPPGLRKLPTCSSKARRSSTGK